MRHPRKDYASDDADDVDDELSAVNVSSFSVFDIRDFRLQSVTACEFDDRPRRELTGRIGKGLDFYSLVSDACAILD